MFLTYHCCMHGRNKTFPCESQELLGMQGFTRTQSEGQKIKLEDRTFAGTGAARGSDPVSSLGGASVSSRWGPSEGLCSLRTESGKKALYS